MSHFPHPVFLGRQLDTQHREKYCKATKNVSIFGNTRAFLLFQLFTLFPSIHSSPLVGVLISAVIKCHVISPQLTVLCCDKN